MGNQCCETNGLVAKTAAADVHGKYEEAIDVEGKQHLSVRLKSLLRLFGREHRYLSPSWQARLREIRFQARCQCDTVGRPALH
jgi:hypothetical protein